MNYTQRLSFAMLFYTIAVHSQGCKKYIDTPTTTTISTIDSLEKCTRLLNNTDQLNTYPMSPELCGDDYTVTKSAWLSASRLDQLLCIWGTDIFEGKQTFSDYAEPYESIYLSNEIIQALGTLTPLPQQLQQRNYLLGASLFHRGTAFFNLLQLFARPYSERTASTDTGISLQLSVDNITQFERSSMKECYDQAIADLTTAATLLPIQSPAKDTRHKPSRTACQAMLARIFLSMGNYRQALQYADSSLAANDSLLDYNSCSEQKPFKESNPEIIYQAWLANTDYTFIRSTQNPEYAVNRALYQSYHENDLRKKLFFRVSAEGNASVKSSYTGGVFFFAGLATDELYLVRAECYAHAGNTAAAMKDLNKLLLHRYKKDKYTARTATTSSEALTQILTERRKELLFRGLRWMDLRRLGKEGLTDTLYRYIDGVRYTLPPNDLRYTLPIPPNALNGGTVQNPR